MKNAFLFALGLIVTAPAHAIHIERLDEEKFFSSTVESNQKMQLPADVEQFLFAEKKGAKTDGLIILKDGEIVYERYARGFDRIRKHCTYSMGKTFSVMMMSIAAKMGYIDMDAPFGALFPFVSPDKSSLTLRNFMTMTSGIKFSEQEVLKFKKPNVIEALYGKHVADIGQYMLSLPQRSAPGTTLDYSSGDTNVMWWALKQQMSKQEYNDFPFSQFFAKLNINDVVFEQDESGTFLGSTFYYLRPIDIAKIGQMILQRGQFQGRQIVEAEFIDFMKTPSPGSGHIVIKKHDPYGGGLWLNTDHKNYPDVDTDMLQAHGFDGQSLTIFPSKKMVIVRLADDSRLKFSWKNYMKLVGGL